MLVIVHTHVLKHINGVQMKFEIKKCLLLVLYPICSTRYSKISLSTNQCLTITSFLDNLCSDTAFCH